MTNATDVIAYLLPRKAAPIVERQTGLPFGWGLWLRALPERLGRITRERADAVKDLEIRLAKDGQSGSQPSYALRQVRLELEKIMER